MENGVKRPITSMQTYVDLGGVGKLIQASDYSLSLIPNGALLSAASQVAPATATATAAAATTTRARRPRNSRPVRQSPRRATPARRSRPAAGGVPQ